MTVDGKLEKKCTNGQTFFYIKKLENWYIYYIKIYYIGKLIYTQKPPFPIICRTPSQVTFTETEYHSNEIPKLYEELRELTIDIKFFVIEQIRLVKNSKFRIHHVTIWLTNNCNTQITKYLTK